MPPSFSLPMQFRSTLSVLDSTYAQVEAGPASRTSPAPSAVVMRAKRQDSVGVGVGLVDGWVVGVVIEKRGDM